MNKQPDTHQKSLKYSIIDGAAYSTMAGFGESFLTPFAIFLNAGNLIIGLLSSLPLLIAAFAQLISANLLDKVGQRKALIITPSFIQMLTWIPIFVLPLLWFNIGPILLIIMVAVYMACVHFTIPSWNSWMGDLVAPDERGDYFGKRNRIASIFSVISAIAAGLILDSWKPVNEWIGYAIIFGAAFIARGVSVYYLKKMVEPPYKFSERDCFSLWDFLRRSPKSNFARFVFFIGWMHLAALFAGPYFAVYLLRDLQFSYTQFMMTLVTSVLSQALVMSYWGRIGDRFGNKKVLVITSWLMPLVPSIWLLSPNFYWILVFQVFNGMVWGGFILAFSNYIFDAVSPPKRARCVAYFSLITHTGIFLGATAGGLVSPHLSNTLNLFGYQIQLVSSLHILFLISGLLRGLVSAIFLPLIKEVRTVEPIQTWRLVFQMIQLRPLLAPIISGLGPVFEIFGMDKNSKPDSGAPPQPPADKSCNSKL